MKRHSIENNVWNRFIVENLTNSDPHSLVYHSILSGEKLATLVQTNYELPAPIRCTLFASGVNDIYEVTAGGQKTVLRVTHADRFGPFDEDAYRFEMALLDFLKAARFPASHAIPNIHQDMIGEINAPEGKRYFMLFSFAEGQIRYPLTPNDAYLLGATLAKLHMVTEGYTSQYSRFELDDTFLIEEPLQRIRMAPSIAGRDVAFLEEVGRSLKEVMHGLPQSPGLYDIIHGDYWWSNAHFLHQQVTLFDFDFCGTGWRIYDLAALRGTAKANGWNLADEVVVSLLDGYQSIRMLSELELRVLPSFEKIRVLWALGLWTTMRQSLGARWFGETVQRVITTLRNWE